MTATAMRHGLFTCQVCELLNRHIHDGEENCARCGAVLRARQRDSLTRTWAYLIAAAVLYVPANILPVMTTAQAPNEEMEDTILSGVIHLWNTGSWGLAIIVFIASIVIPFAKLGSLSYLAWTAQRRSTSRPEQRAWLFRATHYIGRWSMVDIYLGATLVALVQLTPFASVDPGPAAIAFSAVVILTMLATQSFDPRLTWDPLDDKPWPRRQIP